MDKNTRSAIERATQRARRLLEEDFAAQLEGVFDVSHAGVVATKAGPHLTPRQVFQRERIVAAIEHKRAAGMDVPEAVADYLRDAAFTTLNRFIALKMLEARELVQECITKGERSSGYREFCGMAPGLPLLPNSAGYRLYIESLFDELSTEVKVLFDRRDPASVLWPKRAAFEQLLEILCGGELASVWAEDETIGWVYQYFNGSDERRRMRDESQAPRNSRELAVRNQFFTPRYVVQFLTDNTLGRIWFEMRSTKTALGERCGYMVRPRGEERASRVIQDARDLRVLDPACGSGHFLLYAFDLLLLIYEEAHADPASPKSEATGRTLAEDYPTVGALRRAAPGLILTHNLHGVDIDARCAQIAQLALWMRAQKAYRDFGIPSAERPPIRRSNIVVAEPLVADNQLVTEFVAELQDAELSSVFAALVDALKLAGDLGLLLRVERLVAQRPKRGETGNLLALAPTEERIRAALRRFLDEGGARASTRRRLFVDDAAQGIGLLAVAERQFDVVLMNPPFGLMPKYVYEYLVSNYPDAYYDLAATFMARGVELLTTNGLCGAITTRAFMFVADAKRLRSNLILPTIQILADLGSNVMDGAAVDASAQVLGRDAASSFLVVDARKHVDKATALLDAITGETLLEANRAAFSVFPSNQLAYDALESLSHIFTSGVDGVEPAAAIARIGASTFDDDRFLRARWEVPAAAIGEKWLPSSRTAEEFSLFYYPPLFVVKWEDDGREVCARNEAVNGQTAQARQGSAHYGQPGLVFARRSSPSIAFRAHPSGSAFASNTGVVIPKAVKDTVLLSAVLNSSVVRAAVNALSNRDSYTVGHIKKIRWPACSAARRAAIVDAAARIIQDKHWLFRLEETDPWFHQAEDYLQERETETAFRRWQARAFAFRTELISRYSSLEKDVAETFGVADVQSLRNEFGLSDTDVLLPQRLFAVTEEKFLGRCVSICVGAALGRWPENSRAAAACPPDVFGAIPAFSSAKWDGEANSAGILVNDPGHSDDIESCVVEKWSQYWEGDDLRIVEGKLGCALREWIERHFSGFHLDQYSAGKRKAPIYWQLATPSGGYSVWLYIHAFSKDTLFRVQNDYVTPKLVHEERRLEAMLQELRSEPMASARRVRAPQESFVEELRAFLDEVKRVAPLWNPYLDDGVLINFALLWRLVPQHKPWQKALRVMWDALCEGRHDWSRLAMHLWPERVVPKCATDRSLAIAHGLEDVFWAQSANSKWAGRKTPARSVEDLVRERSSTAVKAALKSLLEAPAPAGSGSRERGGRRRTSAAAPAKGEA